MTLPDNGTLFRLDKSWFGRDTKSVVAADAIRTALGTGVLVPVEISDDDWNWLIGWVTAGFSEFLVGPKEHDEEYGRLDRIEAALGIGGSDET